MNFVFLTDGFCQFSADGFLAGGGFVDVESKGEISGKSGEFEGAGGGTDNRLWSWACKKPVRITLK